MTKFRIAAASAAVGIIATTGLVGGATQAHAVPITAEQVATAVSDVPTAFTPWLCKKFRWGPPVCPVPR